MAFVSASQLALRSSALLRASAEPSRHPASHICASTGDTTPVAAPAHRARAAGPRVQSPNPVTCPCERHVQKAAPAARPCMRGVRLRAPTAARPAHGGLGHSCLGM
eukprot:scaffold2200_cov413-Prasinococcus_capsulatus_cf.AAC.19